MRHLSLTRPLLVAPAYVADDAYEAYDSYAVTEEPTVPGVTVTEGHGNVAPRASSSAQLDLQPFLDRVTNLACEKVALKCDTAD